jgi:hypothetical protein
MDEKCACVIQGDIRRGTDEVLTELQKHFDLVILSTWKGEEHKIPKGSFEVIFNKKPENPGFTNRNYQRLSTAEGIKYAEIEGCTHVLKWRTDMLPTKLSLNQLLQWSEYKVPQGVSSRIVTCAFRNLSVETDYFSSIPDLFAFCDIEMMKILWGADGFDFSRSMNVPDDMINECGSEWMSEPNAFELFCAESELYANLRSRLQKKIGRKLCHREIAKNYMYLIDHEKLGICWFAADGGFRSILQALQHPWWTERTWITGEPTVNRLGYPEKSSLKKFRKIITPYVVRAKTSKMKIWYKQYLDAKEKQAKFKKDL